jgi:catechol 2,3-dioxygenase-like lactoylglutathione lyase family enzyme
MADASQPVRFHISLNVSDLKKSVAFFKTLFGKEPAKHRDDYAKFELSDPPLVMSLEPHAPAGRGALNHTGFRFPDSAALVEAQRRLELAGMHTEREEGVECCYGRQTKFWAHDPDGGLWEFYTLEEDIDHRGAGQSTEKVHAHAVTIEPAAIWEHRMGLPFEAPATGSVDEVRLRGTFNLPHTDAETRRILRDACAALRPGGKLLVHTLTAEALFVGDLKLPGPAQYVRHVPVRQTLMNALESAGFTGLYLSKFSSSPCFVVDGTEMRETMITGCKPAPEGPEARCVIYKGPFATVTDDEGHTYTRGEPAAISDTQWTALSKSAIGEHFVSMPSPDVVSLASHE